MLLATINNHIIDTIGQMFLHTQCPYHTLLNLTHTAVVTRHCRGIIAAHDHP